MYVLFLLVLSITGSSLGGISDDKHAVPETDEIDEMVLFFAAAAVRHDENHAAEPKNCCAISIFHWISGPY